MSFFHKKKMSQNLWATIMPSGPVTLILYWPKKKNSGQPRHCHDITEILLKVTLTTLTLNICTIDLEYMLMNTH